MNAKYFLAVAASAIIANNLLSADIKPVKIDKYVLKVPAEFHIEYDGIYAHNFPDGMPMGIGSSITFKSENKDGSIEVYAMGDRGPNAISPKYNNGATKVFPTPDYNPSFGIVRIQEGKAQLIDRTTIKTADGKPITGRPVPEGTIGDTGETAFNDRMQRIPHDFNGLDTEGIAIDRKDGKFWICDEYGPFIAKIDWDGRLIKKYRPGIELPKVIAKRQPNRGMEGIAVTPSNKVYGAVQSNLKIKGTDAPFTRLVELDPESGKTRMLAYPLEEDIYKKFKDAKIGDLHAIDNNRFLIIEQAKKKDKKMHNSVYLIDISGANALEDDTKYEKAKDLAELKKMGVTPVKKTKLFDLRDYGWEPDKAEGITLLPDGKRIVVISDNDFGMKAVIKNQDKACGKASKNYTMDDSGTIYCQGKKTQAVQEIQPNNESASVWVITLPEKL